MRTFTIHWLGSKKEVVHGEGKTQIAAFADACRRAGIGAGAVRAMDYFVEHEKPHCACHNPRCEQCNNAIERHDALVESGAFVKEYYRGRSGLRLE